MLSGSCMASLRLHGLLATTWLLGTLAILHVSMQAATLKSPLKRTRQTSDSAPNIHGKTSFGILQEAFQSSAGVAVMSAVDSAMRAIELVSGDRSEAQLAMLLAMSNKFSKVATECSRQASELLTAGVPNVSGCPDMHQRVQNATGLASILVAASVSGDDMSAKPGMAP
jgi:hypothetical protein